MSTLPPLSVNHISQINSEMKSFTRYICRKGGKKWRHLGFVLEAYMHGCSPRFVPFLIPNYPLHNAPLFLPRTAEGRFPPITNDRDGCIMVMVQHTPSCNSFTQVYNRYIAYWSCLKLNMHRGSMGWIVDLVHHDMWCDFGSWDIDQQIMSHLILSILVLSGLKALHCILI